MQRCLGEAGCAAAAAQAADVPDLDAALAARVYVACRIADRDRAHHLAATQAVDEIHLA